MKSKLEKTVDFESYKSYDEDDDFKLSFEEMLRYNVESLEESVAVGR